MSVLVTLGDLVEDVVVWPADRVVRGTDNAATVHRTAGGSAANVARRASALGTGRLGVRFVGRVGDDPLGDRLVAELEDHGVDVRVQRGGRTGSVVVVVDPDGERTMFPDRGAGAELHPVDPGWLDGATLVHATGYDLDPRHATPAALDALRDARRRGIEVALDLSAATIVRSVGARLVDARLRELAPVVCFANEDEALAMGWTDTRGEVVDDAVVPGRIVVKRGPRPALLLRPGAPPVEVPVSSPEVGGADGASTDVRDTTGAGDAFAAGYLVAAVLGATDVDAVTAGHLAAREVLAVPGSTISRGPT